MKVVENQSISELIFNVVVVVEVEIFKFTIFDLELANNQTLFSNFKF